MDRPFELVVAIFYNRCRGKSWPNRLFILSLVKTLCTAMRVPRISVLNLDEIKAAQERLPWEFRPREVEGKLVGPLVSEKTIRQMREQSIQAGLPWPFEIPEKKIVVNIPFKGHLRERKAPEKKAEIEEKLRQMPKLIENYRKNRTKRKKTALAQYLKETMSKETINTQ